MTRQLRALMDEFDLRRRDYRRMEIALSRHPMGQIRSTIKRIDPKGKKQWPSFHKPIAALPEHIIAEPSWDYRFWHLYDILDKLIRDWDMREMWMIDAMKEKPKEVIAFIRPEDTLEIVYDRYQTIKPSGVPFKIGERWDGEETEPT